MESDEMDEAVIVRPTARHSRASAAAAAPPSSSYNQTPLSDPSA